MSLPYRVSSRSCYSTWLFLHVSQTCRSISIESFHSITWVWFSSISCHGLSMDCCSHSNHRKLFDNHHWTLNVADMPLISHTNELDNGHLARLCALRKRDVKSHRFIPELVITISQCCRRGFLMTWLLPSSCLKFFSYRRLFRSTRYLHLSARRSLLPSLILSLSLSRSLWFSRFALILIVLTVTFGVWQNTSEASQLIPLF